MEETARQIKYDPLRLIDKGGNIQLQKSYPYIGFNLTYLLLNRYVEFFDVPI